MKSRRSDAEQRTKTAIAYIRVSTVKQLEEGDSPSMQRAKIEAWCSANGYKLGAVFSDEGITGLKIKKRPGVQAALEATGKGMALVAYSFSRIARSTRDMISIAELLEKKGADLVSLTERIDTTTAAGKMTFRVLAVLAEFERDIISERTKAVLSHKKGKHESYSSAPLGFTVSPGGKLIENAKELATVKRIQKMKRGGHSLHAIAERLNRKGVRGKKGGRFYASTVRHILSNDLYKRAS